MNIFHYINIKIKSVASSPLACLFPYSNKGFRKFARKRASFTLAETLITLAIIGIIAALTIPNLISKYKKEVAIIKLTKAVSLLKHANTFSKIEESTDVTISPNNTGEALNALNTYYAPYIKFKETKALTYGAIGYLEDGTGIYLRKTQECEKPWSCTYMIICTNPKTCKENWDINKMANSRDSFDWYISGRCPEWTFLKLYNKDREKLKQACKANNGAGMETCSMLICLDGMRINDDYPLKF